MSASSSSTAFQNEKQSIAEDPNSGTDVKPVSIFSNDYKKHDDLKQMLDSNKDALKLDAMKRIVGMIAKGKNASDLFPAVVKNVVSKNVEIKKLVYVYLMRYAEEQQDLALLSISTFQRALKDPNQLIRASALRVLSSIRVPIIATIMMLSIKEAVGDMSPYVRKTAANAITKLYSLDPELKDELISIIEKLLADKTILVVGSAILAFEEVCPERIDLIHKNYRKLCNLLIDIDEWGQVIIINMLTRYARTQFLDPNRDLDAAQNSADNEEKRSSNEENSENDDYEKKFASHRSHAVLDPDHRLLLRVNKPLLQSRNSAVVMSVAQLYYYVAPASEVQLVAKSLVRLLRSHREVQIVVLKNIVSMAQKNHRMFEQHQKSFYVHTNDSIQVKLLKLEILTCLANESTISVILREFQAYVLSDDKEFAAATIHAIGRCASNIKEVAENCLNGLVNLMSKKDEKIVAESVVVIKRLLQSNPSKNGQIIKRMAKMVDKVTVPTARASILWLIGEYSDRVSKLAPDILRKMAKTFCDEEIIVKQQILNLGVKLYLTNQKQVALLVQYILNLAKYDQNYDVRDRARFLRTLLINNENCPNLAKHLKKIMLASKPAPVLQSIYKDSDQYQLGTLSHAISSRVNGYNELPQFPDEAPDPTVRNIELPKAIDASNNNSGTRRETGPGAAAKARSAKSEKFYSDDEEDEEKSQSTEGADPSNDEDESQEEEEETENSDKSSSSESDSEKESEKSEQSDAEELDKESSGESESDTSESESEDDKPQSKSPNNDKNNKASSVAKKTVALSSTSEDSSSLSSDDQSESEKASNSSRNQSESSSSLTEQEQEKHRPRKSVIKEKNKSAHTRVKSKQSPIKKAEESATANAMVSLLDLDFSEPSMASNSNVSSLQHATPLPSMPILSPSLADLANISAHSTSSSFFLSTQQTVVSKKEYELLNKMNGNGLQIRYRFTRNSHPQSNKMISIEMSVANVSKGDFDSFSVSNKKLQAGMSMSDVDEFDLANGQTKTVLLGIDFSDTTQPAQFELSSVYSNDPVLGGTSLSKKWPNLTITCPIGELIQPAWSITENEFNKLQANLKGMNEMSAVVDDLNHAQFLHKDLGKKMLESFNMCQIPSSHQDTLKYAALTASSKTPLLLSIYFLNSANKCQINVNCEKIVFTNMFVKEVKQVLANQN